MKAATPSATTRAAPADPSGPGNLLQLIRGYDAVSRAELVHRTGLSRSTVCQRVDALLAHDLVVEARAPLPSRGRPPSLLTFNARGGLILAADIGGRSTRLAVTDLAG